MDSHRSLIAWQLARSLCVNVLKTTDRLYHPRARALFDQLKRASISIVANIVEGYALGTKPQFRRHLCIALGSAAEVECLLDLAVEVDYLPRDVYRKLAPAVSETMRVTFGLMRNLKTTNV
jgi:four helix bundle protein